jgi:hypothetical protein
MSASRVSASESFCILQLCFRIGMSAMGGKRTFGYAISRWVNPNRAATAGVMRRMTSANALNGNPAANFHHRPRQP